MNDERARRRVYHFLETLATETNVSRSQARVKLARKLAERTRLVRQRRKLRERLLRTLAKELETKEVEVHLVEEEIYLTRLFSQKLQPLHTLQ
ncbi:hypothetical protein AC249_AIPGENE3334 [Exaiptasia diaphana]|nr:hypothetical protein AC249_AIPGENE3334 [Exaiptasia diaphana]